MIKNIVISIANFIFCHVFYRVKEIDKENITKMEKCIICPNHSSNLDPIWIYTKTKNMWVMAKAELFKFKIIGALFRYFNIFPIKRGQKDARSIIHAINILEKNENSKLLIFPEGTRVSKEKDRGRAKAGPVYIAAKTNIPIVPVYITRNAKLFSSPKIIYGEAFNIPSNILDDKKEIQIYSDMLLDKIYELKRFENNSKKG